MRWRRGRHQRAGDLRGVLPGVGAPREPPVPGPPVPGPPGPAPAWRTSRAGGGDRLVVQLPSCAGHQVGRDLAHLVDVALAGGASVVVADLTAVRSWDAAGLEHLACAHRRLAASGASLRLVVWSQDLYQALQEVGGGSGLSVHANIDAALR